MINKHYFNEKLADKGILVTYVSGEKVFKMVRTMMMGMPLTTWTHESCEIDMAVVPEERWATIYRAASAEKGKGHCDALLKFLSSHYSDLKFGCTTSLNDAMTHLINKHDIIEY